MLSKKEKVTFALATPYQFEVFYYSDCFDELFVDKYKQELRLPTCMTEEQLKRAQYVMVYEQILEKFYGIKINNSPELIYQVSNHQNNIKRYYKIYYDCHFIDIRLKGELPAIQNCAVCLNTFRILNLDKELATMPLDLFEIEGFAVWEAEDVTVLTLCL